MLGHLEKNLVSDNPTDPQFGCQVVCHTLAKCQGDWHFTAALSETTSNFCEIRSTLILRADLDSSFVGP